MVHKIDNVPESRCPRERIPENVTPIAASSPCRDGLAAVAKMRVAGVPAFCVHRTRVVPGTGAQKMLLHVSPPDAGVTYLVG